MKTEINSQVLKTMSSFSLPRYEEIPDVGLYLEQTVHYINDCFGSIPDAEITSSMISNYVKKGVVDRSVNKRYYRDHIAYLIFVVVAKGVLSIENISYLFQLQKTSYTAQVAYDYFKMEFENMIEYVSDEKDEIEEIGVTQSEAKMLLRKTIISFAHKMFVDMYLEIKMGESLPE